MKIPFRNIQNKTPPIQGVSIGVNNMRGLCGNSARTYNEIILRKLAQDLARFKVKSSNKTLDKKLNMRANILETATDFWEEFFYRYLSNGVVYAHKKYLIILPIDDLETLDIDDNNNFILGDTTINLSDVLMMRNNNYINQSYTTQLISSKIEKLLASLDKTSVKNFLLKVKAAIKPEELEEMKNNLTSVSEDGIYIIDSKVEQLTQLSGTSSFDTQMYTMLNDDVLALYGLNSDIMNNKATPDVLANYRSETLGPIWDKLIEELKYKYSDNKMIMIPKYKLALNDNQVKQLAMFGGIQINEIRAVYGLDKVPNGDKLIQNWNQKENKQGEPNEE